MLRKFLATVRNWWAASEPQTDPARQPELTPADPAVETAADPAVETAADVAVETAADPAVETAADAAATGQDNSGGSIESSESSESSEGSCINDLLTVECMEVFRGADQENLMLFERSSYMGPRADFVYRAEGEEGPGYYRVGPEPFRYEMCPVHLNGPSRGRD